MMPTVLRVRSRVGRRMNSFCCWARKKAGRLRHQAVTRAMVCSATWSASTPEALVTAIFDSMTEGTQAMVHAGGRGLDPLEPSLCDDAVPVDGHLGMAAEHVGGEEFLGDPLLAGVDDLGLGGRGGDLPDVFRLDRIAENDAHHKSLSEPWGSSPRLGTTRGTARPPPVRTKATCGRR